MNQATRVMLNRFFPVALSMTLVCLIGCATTPDFTQPEPRIAGQWVKPPTPDEPRPTFAEVPYGPHPRQVLDFWKAPSRRPTPVVLYIHGGGWSHGDKEDARRYAAEWNAHGISVASISYRYTWQAVEQGIEPPVAGPLGDAARALQFVRSKAREWNIDKPRIGACGGSAGACTSLWLALHDDMADPKSTDPVARESTRLWCAAVYDAQTTLDPQLMRQWIPNVGYGSHAFTAVPGDNGRAEGVSFNEFLRRRDELLPWIQQYSPYENASADDPPIYMLFTSPPAMGQSMSNATHSANFGVGLKQRLDELGVKCELVYPGQTQFQHDDFVAFFIDTL